MISNSSWLVCYEGVENIYFYLFLSLFLLRTQKKMYPKLLMTSTLFLFPQKINYMNNFI